jgi:hypothetical protein
MENVANIAPMGEMPGLIAFLCSNCGNTHSVIISRDETDHAQDAQEPRDSDHAKR